MKATSIADIPQGARVSVSGVVVQRAGEGGDPSRQLVGIQLPGGQLIQVNPRVVDLPEPEPESAPEPEPEVVQTREVQAPRRRRA